MMQRRFTGTLMLLLLFSAGAESQINSGNPNVLITPNRGSGAQTPSVRRISVTEAQKQVASRKAVLVDVRSVAQYRLGHIKGAYNIPSTQLVSRVRELPFGRTIITYCA